MPAITIPVSPAAPPAPAAPPTDRGLGMILVLTAVGMFWCSVGTVLGVVLDRLVLK